MLLLLSGTAYAKPLTIDDFQGVMTKNSLGLRANVFSQEPSKAQFVVTDDVRDGKPNKVLKVKYRKELHGGPYDSGGWCGYYTILKSDKGYFNASGFTNITFWVRGETGNESFTCGLADKHWEEVGDSVKTEEAGKYLPTGKISKDWQKFTLPLYDVLVDYTELASFALVFEKNGEGLIYVDDIQLE